jgi:hypothetical protein
MSNLDIMLDSQAVHDEIVDQAADIQKSALNAAILKHFKKSDQKPF